MSYSVRRTAYGDCNVRRTATANVRRTAYGVDLKRRACGVGRRSAVGVLTLFTGIILLAAPRAAGAQDTGLTLGSTAPSAMLETLDGKATDLAQVVKGGPAVIEFWATWCENCEHLLPAMQRAAAKYGDKVKFVAVAVSVNQSPKRVQLHVAKHKVPGIQLFDTKGDAAGKWDVPATSHVVVLDKRGKVVYTGVGGDQDIEAAIRKAM